MNRLKTILVSLTTAIILIIGISCQNSLVQNNSNPDQSSTTTTIDLIKRGNLRIYIDDNLNNRTIINDVESIVFDLYAIVLTSNDSFTERSADFTTNAATFNNIEAGSWNISVEGKQSGLTVASGYLADQTIDADTTTDINIVIKLMQIGTGGVSIRISFPSASNIDYLSAQIEGYIPVDLTIDASSDATYKIALFEKSGVPSGMKDLVLTFKSASGTILGMYRESVNIFDDQTSDKWINGSSLSSIYLFDSTSDFASTNANLFDLTTDVVWAFDSPFGSFDYDYNLTVPNSLTSIKFKPTQSIIGQAIRIRINNGGYSSVISGTLSSALTLNEGDNTIDVEVTAQDYATQKFYQIIVKRLPKPTAPVISITGTSYGERYTFNPGNNIYYDLTTDYSNRIYHHWTKTSSSTPSDPPDPILPDPTTAHNLYYPPAFDEGSRYIWEAPGQTIKWIIKAIAYNEFDETSDVATYRITLDNLKPFNPVLTPGDGSTDVSGDTNLVMTFWETIKKGTGNIYIKRYSDDFVIETIDVTSAQVTIADKVLTVNPAASLTEDGMRYYINIDNTAILDIVGNAYLGISDKDSWDFATKDFVAPTAMLSNLPPLLTNQPSALITVGGTDVVSYKYKLDGDLLYGSEAPVGTQINLVGLSDAPHTVYVIGKDAAGNWQAEAGATSYTWVVDNTAPAAPVVSSITGRYNIAQTFTISGESGAAIEYSLNNGSTWTPYSGEVTISDTPDSTNDVIARQTDPAGNISVNSAVITVIIDKTAPQITNITSLYSDGTYTKDQTIDITVQFSEIVTISGGISTLSLNSDGTADYLSGSATDTLTFRYVVGAGEIALDLDVQAVNLNLATIKDAAGNNADLTPPALANLIDNKNLVIDGTTPRNVQLTITLITPTYFTVSTGTTPAEINKNIGENLFVTATVDGGSGTYWKWYLDGVVKQEGLDSSYSISSLSADCYLGIHNLAVVVTKDGKNYSAQITFKVVSR